MAKPQYGWQHQRERKRWRTLVDNGEVHCCLCGAWLEPGSAFDLDHLPGTDQYRGAACPTCNRADGGRRRHQEPREPRRWEL